MSVRVAVPPSKSYTQRALVLAALSDGESTIENAADCDDSRLLVEALTKLGVDLRWSDGELAIEGGRPLSRPPGPLNLGNSGTALRFLSAFSLLTEFELELEGIQAMGRRPMPGLIDALRSLGVEVIERGSKGCPPVTLKGSGHRGGRVRLDPSGSSQQLSALLLVAPRLAEGLTIEVAGPIPSSPYVEMTIQTLDAFGGQGRWLDSNTIEVEAGRLEGRHYVVEGDWSAAAMVLAGGFITGRPVEIENLPVRSLQGDRIILDVLNRLERGRHNTLDLESTPDLVPAVVAAALFANGETRIEGIGHLRFKESDRLAVLADELTKLGASIQQESSALSIRPKSLRSGAPLDPHGDHRMAMAFGLVSLGVSGIEVLDRGCVSKSFPRFWDVLKRLR